LLLEGWVAQLATSEPIHEAMEKLRRIFGIPIAVDSAERILERVAKNAEHFQDNLPHVEVAAEGELLVETTDNKGIVMRHKSTAEKLPVGAPSTRRGPIPDRKQMATVCGCYSIAPHVRTPQDVLEALFREPKLDEMFDEILRKRPRPIQSRYQACLSRDQERVDILDVIHGIQRVWDAGAILDPDNLTSFAKMHIRSILEGKVKHVIHSFRWQATNRSLKGSQKEAMRKICGFLKHNADRMKYDEYLAKGYPIASGFIEGACRHLVKDRMERSGMRWTVHGAQNMLYLRCIHAGKLWSEFLPQHQTRTLSHFGTRTNYLEQFQLAA